MENLLHLLMTIVRRCCAACCCRRLELGEKTALASPPPRRGGRETKLTVMTLNLQFFAAYPKDARAAKERLLEVTGGPCPPDVICVQEGLRGKEGVLDEVGYDLLVCAGQQGSAQSVHDMVYGDQPTLKIVDEALHQEILCNQLYIRRSSRWAAVDCGAQKTSSDINLEGGCQRAQGKLAVRSMVWAKLRRRNASGESVYVLNTHLTGGRFEDQYFMQQLADERFRQVGRVLDFFDERPEPCSGDLGIIVGDFNATAEYTAGGAMQGYFKSSIANASGVLADARADDLGDDLPALEARFKAYMTSPFRALRQRGWSQAYGDEVGPTSAFGHLIDHMATSRQVAVERAEVIHLTNQRFGSGPKDTDLPLTDHNAVKTVFLA